MRPFDYEFLVDGQPMLLCDGDLQLRRADVEADSGRDEAGWLHRAVLRRGVRSWRFSYALLSMADYRYLTGLLESKPYFDFTLRRWDGSVETVRACCTESEAALEDRTAGILRDLKFTVSEC